MSQIVALKDRAPGFAEHPGYQMSFEPADKRVKVVFNGEVVADSSRAMILRETRLAPVYYLPRQDVRMAALKPSEHLTYCPFKGNASYWHLKVGDKTAENAVWSYELPFDEVAGIKDYVALYWNRVDHWYEEDEEVFVHARSPRVRVDILDSSRPVRIELGGETVAETTEARFLFETGLPTRYYIPRKDVSVEPLPSDTQTQCPYKGAASYHSVQADDTVYEDIVWYYTDPVHESAKIKDYLCFYNEKVDLITVDGQEIPKQKTPWSDD